jgi:hypothetical protein
VLLFPYPKKLLSTHKNPPEIGGSGGFLFSKIFGVDLVTIYFVDSKIKYNKYYTSKIYFVNLVYEHGGITLS